MTELVNGWFPKIRTDGAIASGNAGIWITLPSGYVYKHSEVGTSPIWAALTLIFNRNDGTSMIGNQRVPTAYNSYTGSDSGNWVGFYAPSLGRIDRYNGPTLIQPMIDGVCNPRFYGPYFGYLRPFQTNGNRELVIEDITVHNDIILDWIPERSGKFYVYSVSTGTYTKEIKDKKGIKVNITNDEAPIVAFINPANEEWLVTGTNKDPGQVFIRPINSDVGYEIRGDMFYPDARMIGDKLRVVASYGNGQPRFDEWIDFTKPRKKLS